MVEIRNIPRSLSRSKASANELSELMKHILRIFGELNDDERATKSDSMIIRRIFKGNEEQLLAFSTWILDFRC